MNRDELIKQAEVWYRKQDYSPDFPLFKIMADFVLSEIPAIHKAAVAEFLVRVRKLEPLLYKAAFEEADKVEWDYFEEAIKQVYAEMFGGDGNDA